MAQRGNQNAPPQPQGGAAAVPVAQNPQQVQAQADGLQDLIGGRRKPANFETGDSLEWKTWRRSFEILRRLNDWNNVRARQEISISMVGRAALAVRGIPVGDVAAAGAQVAPYEELLNEYEARFVPPHASMSARNSFITRIQQPSETVTQFGSSLRSMFEEAYPGNDADAVNNSTLLKHQFLTGLRDQWVRMEVRKTNQENITFPQMMTTAVDMESNVAVERHLGGGKGKLAAMTSTSGQQESPEYAGIAAAQRGRPASDGKCWLCKGNHFLRDCSIYKRSKALGQELAQRGKGNRFRGKPGGRGRGKFPSRGGANRRGGAPSGRGPARRKSGISAMKDEDSDGGGDQESGEEDHSLDHSAGN